MLEEYLDIITNMENYVDGVIVLDKDAKVIHINQFRPDYTPLDEKRALGKSLFEIYPDLDPETSTIMQALKYGKVTLNNEAIMYPTVGHPFRMVDNTFPIKEDNKIIGAVCITTFPDRTQKTSMDFHSKNDKARKGLYQVTDIIGRSTAIQDVRSQVGRVSKTSSSVLIYGATGTGKELVAQSIHTGSSRKNKPFLSQNCAAIPATLLESLFFGTTKGSYTGAEEKKGIFETANGGTIFLDEINSMDITLQAKLLRVLEEHKVTRVGSTESIDVDVRIIAATNKAPIECIHDGTLRADLFYRLGSVTIDLPELKQRKDDIDLLAEYFISIYNASMHKNIIGVSQGVMTIFKSYSWPGNIREFRNVIEGAFNLCEGTIISKDNLPSYLMASLNLPQILPESAGVDEQLPWMGSLKKNVDAYEKKLIAEAIYKFPSLSAAADYLGITRQSLNQKLNKYNLK